MLSGGGERQVSILLTFHFFPNTCHENFSNTRGSRRNAPVQTHSPSSRRSCTIYCTCSPPSSHPPSSWAGHLGQLQQVTTNWGLHPTDFILSRPGGQSSGIRGCGAGPSLLRVLRRIWAGPPPAPGVASILVVLGWWLRCPVSACVITSPPPFSSDDLWGPPNGK